MKGQRTKFVNLVFLLFAILLVALSIFSYRHINQQAEASDWIAHSYLVKLRLENAFITLQRAESAQRGFILTRDSNFVTRFFQAKSMIPAKLAEIDSLVNYNPEQSGNFEKARTLFSARVKYLEMVLDTAFKVSSPILDALLIKGKELMDSLSNQISTMNNLEELTLTRRIAENKKEKQNSSAFILAFSLLSISVLILTFLTLKRETRLLNVAEINKSLLEEKVSERTAELQAVNEILSRQKLELERKNEELNSYTFIASHDLKEPLRKIKTYSSKILQTDESLLSENGKNFLGKITESINKMNNLIESLVNYAQADKELELEKTDLMQTVAHAVNTLQDRIQDSNAVVEYANLPTIKAMPDQMEQLFTNLISNALKYSKSDTSPHIKINAQKLKDNGKGYWEITVSDNGIGFDPKYKEKIFDIFQRLHPKNQYSGTGIGLAICKKIVERHKGRITANATQGNGAVFTIILPLN